MPYYAVQLYKGELLASTTPLTYRDVEFMREQARKSGWEDRLTFYEADEPDSDLAEDALELLKGQHTSEASKGATGALADLLASEYSK